MIRHFVRLQKRDIATRSAADDQVTDALIRDRLKLAGRCGGGCQTTWLVSLIRRACIAGHTEAAKGLWVVLRDLTDREARQRYPHGCLPDEARCRHWPWKWRQPPETSGPESSCNAFRQHPAPEPLIPRAEVWPFCGNTARVRRLVSWLGLPGQHPCPHFTH
jgi:hypothetical protein